MDKAGHLTVDSDQRERLDRYLASKLGFTRTKIKRMIEKGMVEVNGALKSSHYLVSRGDVITYSVNQQGRAVSDNQDIALKIIYQDEAIAVIDKPPSLVVHPAPTQKQGTLLDGLLNIFATPHIVHRLDKDTSGIIVVALNESAALDLRQQFKDRMVKKVYLALVSGRIKEDSGEIQAPIRRSRREPTKMSVGWVNARQSITRFKVKERFGTVTLVEAYPLSGRTHQIRVHFAYYGHPVIGDSKYGRDMPLKAPRQMLHAWQISFKHPGTGEIVHFESPVPDDFREALQKAS